MKSKKSSFCEQLSYWLLSVDWHFTTMLGVFIEKVEPLPDNADQLINEILLVFPDKPNCPDLYKFLVNHDLIAHWFIYLGSKKPRINNLNLDETEFNQISDSSLPQLFIKEDLAQWLNVSCRELEWLSDLKRRDFNVSSKLKHYHYHLIEKRRGGFRLIESPKSLLTEIQRNINSVILQKIPVHSCAHGFCLGRNALSHAQNHCEKENLLLFDIADYFHSIQWPKVYRIFSGLGYSKEVSKYLTGLCTHQLNSNESILNKLDGQSKQLVLQRHLPQGAPSSPALSNLVMKNLDSRLNGLAKSLDLNYSRYADDLAFSGNQRRNWTFMEPLIGSICIEEGFVLNYRKSRHLKPHQRQKLTGIVVNKFPNVDRRYFDDLKATLTNCVRFGLHSQNKDQHQFFYEHLEGAVNHVASLNENRGKKLRKIFNQITIVDELN